MAQLAIRTLATLDAGLILAPERYDPRRASASAEVVLANVAQVVREQLQPKQAVRSRRYLVLDTGDASNGIIRTHAKPVSGKEIGSTKKLVRPGDVIISRLRPYLRQVALVDPELTASVDDAVILVSSEFFVLRSRDERSIAFLVPWLLSAEVQTILAAAQEGGHHPRFNQRTLEQLGIAEAAAVRRDELSREVERAIREARTAELRLTRLVEELDG